MMRMTVGPMILAEIKRHERVIHSSTRSNEVKFDVRNENGFILSCQWCARLVLIRGDSDEQNAVARVFKSMRHQSRKKDSAELVIVIHMSRGES